MRLTLFATVLLRNASSSVRVDGHANAIALSLSDDSHSPYVAKDIFILGPFGHVSWVIIGNPWVSVFEAEIFVEHHRKNPSRGEEDASIGT
jgi:hypothetical protein